jgi:hypothetical protein
MLFITWCCDLERMPEFMSSSELVDLTILAKKNYLSSEFPEVKNQKVKKMYLRRALDSVQFFSSNENGIWHFICEDCYTMNLCDLS